MSDRCIVKSQIEIIVTFRLAANEHTICFFKMKAELVGFEPCGYKRKIFLKNMRDGIDTRVRVVEKGIIRIQVKLRVFETSTNIIHVN